MAKKLKAGTKVVYRSDTAGAPRFAAATLPGGKGNVALVAFGDTPEEALSVLDAIERTTANSLSLKYGIRKPG